ncbi:unnamed protein product [Caenorhabditis bovis]|uniref:Uncharacterized protein n=1 Tax=Caenorhabditis bovis TaxID=2654633 RepID=A0A8S1EVA8_9PELO|nr:unnamed protein product [Caenorhabditis bovis]
MQRSYEYSLLDFTERLAKAEARFGDDLHSIIETFTNSRLDLPLKRLDDLSKLHTGAARNLRKMMDAKKSEALNLWKLCNIYSVAAVELDKSMRAIRASLRAQQLSDVGATTTTTTTRSQGARQKMKSLIDEIRHGEPKWRNPFQSRKASSSRKNTGGSSTDESSPPPAIPHRHQFAPTVYTDLQKATAVANGIADSLRHQDDRTVIRIKSDTTRRPPIAQKPRLKRDDDDDVVPPTMITVDCATPPTPSPRAVYYGGESDAPPSQRLSSSAYSSNYSTTSSSNANVTMFNVDSRPPSSLEHARLVHIGSDENLNRLH